MSHSDSGRTITWGIVAAFALLIAAVWASNASLATSLAVTGGLVLVGVGTLAMVSPERPPRDATDDQRDRMRNSIP